MNYILFDDFSWQNLLPLTFTRPVADIRCGILTIKEKWEKWLGESVSYKTQEYLQEKFPLKISSKNTLINGSILPNEEIIREIQNLESNVALFSGSILLAIKLNEQELLKFDLLSFSPVSKVESSLKISRIAFPWDIFSKNGQEIASDFAIVTKGRKSAPISPTNQVRAKENIFLEEGAVVECSILNATNSYIYIGRNAEIMEGSIIRGSFVLGDDSTVKLGAKIYGPTTVGKSCRVGGEINNSVIFAYSNKGHDGFLGNAVMGEWCNIGADSNNSNLKNNYAEVKVWNYPKESFIRTGLQFCGLVMGDHSKCGINTMFNTGTVVGVSANVFGAGFPRNFVPDFSWGGASGMMVYTIDKAFETAQRVMERRNMKLEDVDKKILTSVFEQTSKFRKF